MSKQTGQKSGLTSLLQYRFVKKDSLTHGSNSSDSQSSGSETVSPSQASTISPQVLKSIMPASTPEKKPLSVQVTPDSKTVTSPGMSSPDSPVFGTKPRLIDRQWGETPEIPSSSGGGGAWLSKSNGQVINGNAGSSSKRKQNLAAFRDDSDEELTIIDDLDGKMSSLRAMFPVKPDSELRQAILQKNGDLEAAIDLMMGVHMTNNTKARFKRIRKDNVSPEANIQPRKRIRQISSSSGDDASQASQNSQSSDWAGGGSQGTVADSQGTVAYSLESQRSDATVVYDVDELEPLTDEQQKKITFLRDCYHDKSEKELRRALSDSGWNVANATVTLSSTCSLKSITSENKVRAQAAKHMKKSKVNRFDVDIDDEDEDYSGGSDSDDSIEEEGDSGKSVILSFFEDATIEELMATPGCSKKKSDLIIQQRPFKNWANLVEKFVTVKGLTYDLIMGCREFIRVREVVIRLMKRCEAISNTMQKVVSELLHSNTMTDDDTQITKQPKLLNPGLQLKPFQMVGLNWLKIMHTQEINGILADEMGLGKTIQTISFLAHLLEEGEPGPHLIIVPSSTIDNWIRECKVWCPSMKVLVYYGSQEERRATRQLILYNNDQSYNVIITTYNMATGSVEDRALFKKFEFHYAVFDEGHLLKNMSSLRYQNLMRIEAHRRLLLTGTPLQNNLVELMSLLCFVMPDMFVGKTEQLKRVFTSISRSSDEKGGRSSYEQQRIRHAKQIMRPFVLRRLKSEVMSQMPRKLEGVEYCEMIPDQQKLYARLIDKFTNQITDSGEETTRSAMLMELRKAANHPLLHRSHYTDAKVKKMAVDLCKEPSHSDRGALPKLVEEDMRVMSDFELHKCCKFYAPYLNKYLLDENYLTDSGKFRMLDGLLDKHRDDGHRVLLFSQFTTMLDIMEGLMKKKKIRFLRLDGSTPVPERQRLIDEYNNDKGIFVFLLSTKAGGLGINLTSANVVILHDIDFNPYNDKQAEDRCHRVGQTREVQIVRLISKDTVEEAMLKCSQEKLKLERDVISTDDLEDEKGKSKDVASILKQALKGKS